MSVNLMKQPVADQIAAIYVAYFGRSPDPEGHAYWATSYAAREEQGWEASQILKEMSEQFRHSAEAKALYPALDPANAGSADAAAIGAFIDTVYDNLFERAPDAAGRAYWSDEIVRRLAAGEEVGSFLVDVMAGAQDDTADASTLDWKMREGLAEKGRADPDALDFDALRAAVRQDPGPSEPALGSARGDVSPGSNSSAPLVFTAHSAREGDGMWLEFEYEGVDPAQLDEPTHLIFRPTNGSEVNEKVDDAGMGELWMGAGRTHAAVEVPVELDGVDDGPHDFSWGLLADGPLGTTNQRVTVQIHDSPEAPYSPPVLGPEEEIAVKLLNPDNTPLDAPELQAAFDTAIDVWDRAIDMSPGRDLPVAVELQIAIETGPRVTVEQAYVDGPPDNYHWVGSAETKIRHGFDYNDHEADAIITLPESHLTEPSVPALTKALGQAIGFYHFAVNTAPGKTYYEMLLDPFVGDGQILFTGDQAFEANGFENVMIDPDYPHLLDRDHHTGVMTGGSTQMELSVVEVGILRDIYYTVHEGYTGV